MNFKTCIGPQLRNGWGVLVNNIYIKITPGLWLGKLLWEVQLSPVNRKIVDSGQLI